MDKLLIGLGATIQIIQLVVLSIFGLSYVNWGWFSSDIAKIIIIGFTWLLINLFSFWVIYLGTGEKR